MPTERFQFTGIGGHQLAAALDMPEREPLAYALFAHCFTCGKDVLAAKRIAVALAAEGIAVLRFDFTGLGSSEGDFANSTFSSNVADLVRAADHLRQTRKGPAILIGHSLGGAAYVADVIAAWTSHYLDPVAPEQAVDPGEAPRNVVVRETRNSKFQQTVSVGPHRMLADEPVAAGGEDSGPGPYDFVLAGLGACTSMTMRLYAERKSLPLERVTVTLKHSKIHAEDCAECETKSGMLDQIERVIAMEGNLDTEQRKKLMEIADKCPVHRTLTSEVHIVTHAAD